MHQTNSRRVRRRSRRGVAALALILALMGMAGVAAFAVAGYRGGVARQLSTLEGRQELRGVAEAALLAASSRAMIEELLVDPASVAAWLASLSAGDLTGGVIVPGDPGLTLAPPEVTPAGTGWTVSPVRVRAVEYMPGANLGLVRLSVDVSRGERRGTFAHDHAFTLRNRAGGGLRLVVARDPAARIY